jgi:dCMP deaminase
MMSLALLVAWRSTCKRLRVGSVITDNEIKNILAYGYNGNYAGGPNTCDSDEEGNCGCLHSENNSLIKSGQVREGVMFITVSPCKMCSKLIINAGIKKVYYHDEYRSKEGLNILKKAGVGVYKI